MNPTSADIRATVKERFAAVAASPGLEKKFPVGPASARKLGYDPREIDALPATVTESFCGVGNPLGLGELHPGQTVLDLLTPHRFEGVAHRLPALPVLPRHAAEVAPQRLEGVALLFDLRLRAEAQAAKDRDRGT